jgi:hypothetical protein
MLKIQLMDSFYLLFRSVWKKSVLSGKDYMGNTLMGTKCKLRNLGVYGI